MPPFRAPMPRRPTFRTHISGALTTLAVCAVGCGAASGSTEAFVTSGDAGLGPEVVSLRADAGSDGAREASSVGPVCGDQICNGTESCTTCPTDCGTCPSCSAAPSCSDGLALPSNPKTLKLSELTKPISHGDAGAPDTTSCTGAQLRLRIARIEVGHQGKRV